MSLSEPRKPLWPQLAYVLKGVARFYGQFPHADRYPRG